MADYGMMLNDKEGDCCIAAVGHCIQVLHAGETPTDQQIEAAYREWCDGIGNSGCSPLRVLQRWTWNGLGGRTLWMFGRVTNAELPTAVKLSGVAYASMKRFMSTTSHSLAVIGHDGTTVTYISWGNVYTQSVAQHNADVDQCWAISEKPSLQVLYWMVKNNWKLQVSALFLAFIAAYGVYLGS